MKYIIGMGNIMRADDGIGPRIIDYIVENNLAEDFTALDFATDAWGILPLLTTQTKKILILDCSHLGKPSGEFQFFSLTSIIDKNISSVENHESSIAQLINIAQCSDYFIPEISIMGIEPESIKFSQSLSLKLEQQLTHYTQQAIQAIRA